MMMRLGHLPTEEELKRMVAEVGPVFFCLKNLVLKWHDLIFIHIPI